MKKYFSIVVLVVLLGGCKSTPLVTSFVSSSVPADEHSFLTLNQNFLDVMIDGVKSITASGLGGGYIEKEAIVLLPPGSHTVTGKYYEERKSISLGSQYDTITTNITESKPFTIENDFISKHYYYLELISYSDNTISAEIIDETDPMTVWNTPGAVDAAQKRINDANKKLKSYKPSSAGFSVIGDKNAVTELEGRWKQDKSRDPWEMVLEGNMFTLIGVITGQKVTYGGQFILSDNKLSMNVALLNGTAAPSFLKVTYKPTYKINEDKLVLGGGYPFDGEYSK